MSTIDFTVDVPTGMTTVQGELKVAIDGKRLSVKGEYSDVEVFAADGKAMRISRVAEGVYSLNSVPAGVYVVSVKTASGVKTMKATVK